MKQIPLLVMGDNPTLSTGLARIGRDLAMRTAALPQFRLGYFGRGGLPSRYLPFPLYAFSEAEQWGENLLESVWTDFAGNDRGIVFTIWDPTRLSWLALPHLLPDCSLRTFLLTKPFDLWGYFPVDSCGPSGGLSALASSVVAGYDRVRAYTKFGADVLGKSLGRQVDWAPHGIDASIFTPQKRDAGRDLLSAGSFRVFSDDVLLGVVAINQPRKDWGLVAAVCAQLKNRYGKRFKAWWHTDVLERTGSWNMQALAADFGLGNSVLATVGSAWKDKQMSLAYSACNLTLAPGMEGFGFPIVESMACGVPVVTGDRHGGTELVTGDGGIVVEAVGERMEGIHPAIRTVHDPQKWVEAAVNLIENPRDPQAVRERATYLDWNKTLWKGAWKRWMEAGVKA